MADQIIQHTEEMVGAGHPTKSDTLNRALLIEHNSDGTHKFAEVGPGAGLKGAVIKPNAANPNYQVDIDADEIEVYDSDTVATRKKLSLKDVSLTVDLTASGANGLDSGAEAADTTYFLWVCSKSDGTGPMGMFSTSSTISGLAKPSSYSDGYFRLVGFARNDASSNLMDFIQRGNLYSFDDRGQGSGDASVANTNYTAATVSIIPTAKLAEIRGWFWVNEASQNWRKCGIRREGTGGDGWFDAALYSSLNADIYAGMRVWTQIPPGINNQNQVEMKSANGTAKILVQQVVLDI